MHTDDLNSDTIRTRMHQCGCTWKAPITIVASTISTNDDAKSAAAQGALEGGVFVADVQERGRGRQGRPWVAPAGSALLVSIIQRPLLTASALPPLALVAGLAISDVLQTRVHPDRIRLKWPNDVLIDGRKVCGILVEASLTQNTVKAVIIGFGINIRKTSFSPDLASRAISLEDAGATELNRSLLLADCLCALEARFGVFVRKGLSGLLPDLRARDGALGRHVSGETVSGIAAGIADDGKLLICNAQGLVAVSSGEVSFGALLAFYRASYGYG